MGPIGDNRLTIDSPIPLIIRAILSPENGLEIRDRMWLKINIPNAFIGKCSSYGLTHQLVD